MSEAIEFPSNAACADALAELWREADVHPVWPCATDEAVQLLRAAGYDVTIELLDGWARSRQIDVRITAGRFAWTPQAVYVAGSLCESQRRWIALHPKHIHKMTGPEVAEAQAAAIGASIFQDLDKVDFRSIIGLLQGRQGADDNLRATLCVALLTKLKAAGLA